MLSPKLVSPRLSHKSQGTNLPNAARLKPNEDCDIDSDTDGSAVVINSRTSRTGAGIKNSLETAANAMETEGESVVIGSEDESTPMFMMAQGTEITKKSLLSNRSP
jgi:hypothetical protein